MSSRGGLLVIFCLSFYVTSSFAGEAKVDVVLSPAGSFQATTKKVTGFATKSADGTVTAKNIKVDLRTLTTGVGLRDTHTKKHLKAEKYPYAKLIKASGKNGKGKALIEVAGKRQEVEGTFTVVGKELHATFPMNLKKLDIKDVNYMGVGVNETVNLNVAVPIKGGRMPASTKKTTTKKKKK